MNEGGKCSPMQSFTITPTLERNRDILPSFFPLVCVKENENRLFCKDFTDSIQLPPTLFPLTLRDSQFSHGNILNSLKLSFPRLNWDERGLVVIMKFFVFYYSSTPSTVSSKMLLVYICKWNSICSIYSVFTAVFNKTVWWHRLPAIWNCIFEILKVTQKPLHITSADMFVMADQGCVTFWRKIFTNLNY
jgi:hypothetical protein